jgi:hypothetical protein
MCQSELLISFAYFSFYIFLLQLPSPNGIANKETKPEAASEPVATETTPEETTESAKTETTPEAESEAAAANPTEGEKSKSKIATLSCGQLCIEKLHSLNKKFYAIYRS